MAKKRRLVIARGETVMLAAITVMLLVGSYIVWKHPQFIYHLPNAGETQKRIAEILAPLIMLLGGLVGLVALARAIRGPLMGNFFDRKSILIERLTPSSRIRLGPVRGVDRKTLFVKLSGQLTQGKWSKEKMPPGKRIKPASILKYNIRLTKQENAEEPPIVQETAIQGSDSPWVVVELPVKKAGDNVYLYITPDLEGKQIMTLRVRVAAMMKIRDVLNRQQAPSQVRAAQYVVERKG